MHDSKKRAWLIGLYAVVVLTLLVVFYNYLKGRSVFRTVNYYYAYFDNVEGLYKSNKVILNGMRIGDVSDMRMAGDNSGRILVQFQIPNTQKICRAASATIINTGLVGGRVIRLDNAYGPGPFLQDGDTIQGVYRPSYAEIMEEEFMPLLTSGDSLMTQIKDMVGWLHSGLDEEARQDLRSILTNTRESTDGLRAAMQGLPATIHRANTLMAELQLVASQAGVTLGRANGLADTIGAMGLQRIARQLDTVLGNLGGLSARLADPHSSLGRFTGSDSIYLQLERTVQHLDSLLVDVKRNPKRYVGFSLF